MRCLAPVVCLATYGLVAPVLADAADPVPGFDLTYAIECLAHTTVNAERNDPGTDRASLAQEMVFFARLIAAKSSAADHAAFAERFAGHLKVARDLHADLDDPAKRDEADEILTGTGKMCWYHALAAEGGPYFEP